MKAILYSKLFYLVCVSSLLASVFGGWKWCITGTLGILRAIGF